MASILAASPGGANASTLPRAARKEKLLVGYNAPMIAKLVIRLRLDRSACANLRPALAWAVEKWKRFGTPRAYEGPQLHQDEHADCGQEYSHRAARRSQLLTIYW